MPKHKGSRPYARIAITLPSDVLARADRFAREWDRSRSWVIAEAIRRIATPAETARPAAVREPDAPVYAAAEVAAARLHHIRAALRMSPAERLQRADELATLAGLAHPKRHTARIIGFDSLEDFAEWKYLDRIRLTRSPSRPLKSADA